MPNPRGSYGQGERFTRANVKDFGYGDLRDILAGVDEVLRTRPVDENRLGITGWSYGGYMTMWAVTQTDRFRAAVAGAGIANWQSYYGQNGIDQWMIPFFGASVYDDPAVYARSSPITFIKQREDADADPGRRAGRGMPGAPVLGVLARAQDAGRDDAAGGLSGRGPHDLPARAPPGPSRADGGVVRPVPDAGAGAGEPRQPLNHISLRGLAGPGVPAQSQGLRPGLGPSRPLVRRAGP